MIERAFDQALLEGEPVFVDDDFVDESEPEERIEFTLERYVYGRYDWDATGSKCDFIPVRLRGKRDLFFATCETGLERLMAVSDKWYANLQWGREALGQDPDQLLKAYVYTLGRKKATQYAHRVVIGASKFDPDVDHCLGDPFDNRLCTLAVVGTSINLSNLIRKRKSGLKPGVEYVGRKEDRVRGVIKILIDGKRTNKRSEETWPVAEQDKAHQWFLAEREKRFGKRLCIHTAGKQDQLIFPPLRKLMVPVSFPGFVRGEIIESPVPF
jgi:hypothetical protein